MSSSKGLRKVEVALHTLYKLQTVYERLCTCIEPITYTSSMALRALLSRCMVSMPNNRMILNKKGKNLEMRTHSKVCNGLE